ncbi:hypothetical protein L1987_73800 [Smallanthus sonchifolius]|uniref:Uncharacterized protein n=1 Tax=Smallanthus sonchifolius TaxID=185202 RepID=A0ACB9A115_9ASTR|nr:hypothetical protein L1987_73800 [Smallanthus sonchifolius]
MKISENDTIPCKQIEPTNLCKLGLFATKTMDRDATADVNAPHSMGTTIIGVTYNGGVILGADSRTSTGLYVANRASDKITQLTDNVYNCRSGSAADSQIVSDYVRYFLHQHTIWL